jgi:hypothetical protein
MNLISGKGETTSRLPAFSLFLPGTCPNTRDRRKAYTANPKYTANIRLLVASLAAAGALEEARRVGQALLQLEPGFHVRKFCDGYAYRDPERRATLARHLLLAGLPE